MALVTWDICPECDAPADNPTTTDAMPWCWRCGHKDETLGGGIPGLPEVEGDPTFRTWETLRGMSKSDLIAWATDAGYEVDKSMTKAEVLDAIGNDEDTTGDAVTADESED